MVPGKCCNRLAKHIPKLIPRANLDCFKAGRKIYRRSTFLRDLLTGYTPPPVPFLMWMTRNFCDNTEPSTSSSSQEGAS